MTTPDVTDELVTRVIERIGRERWLRFSAADQSLVRDCCRDAAALQMSLLLIGDDATAAEIARREKTHITAQLLSVSAAAGIALEEALWESASQLLLRAGRVLLG